MAAGVVPERATPAWYRRLPPALRRVAADSDRVPTLPLRAGPDLRQLVSTLPAVLATGRCADVESRAQRVADGICRALDVARVRVLVRERRPHDARGELHGLYTPAPPPDACEVTLWMFTAKRGQIVASRTFLRTLLHELCHHFDYTWLRLRESLHTQGFYQRESSLLAALEVQDSDAG
jgi:hypothetical protein